MPAVLRILWQSGRAVVTWGLFLRLVVAMLPFGIAKIAAYILNDIAEVIRGHALAANFWHLVAAEVVLNVSSASSPEPSTTPTHSSPIDTLSTSASGSWSRPHVSTSPPTKIPSSTTASNAPACRPPIASR
ncbi:hypothetical protein RBB78_19065 [Tunturiibacter empetritectus]|uniref:hypothetical protein n=1 Tax=Tunturiibacter empetritectus TaxID=3069691 RepID=UPI003D9AB6D0